jgi:predicted Mrr-cat superfamily restriction endonuclease
MPELRMLLVEHYDALDVETKRLVPLTKLYWPASDS